MPGLEIADARQTLTIGTADMETARALSMPLNAPVAFVHRRACDRDGVALLIADGIYRGDVVRLDVKLRSTGGLADDRNREGRRGWLGVPLPRRWAGAERPNT